MSAQEGLAVGTAGRTENTAYVLDMLLQLAVIALNNSEEALASDIVQAIELYAARTTAGVAPLAGAGRIGVSRA